MSHASIQGLHDNLAYEFQWFHVITERKQLFHEILKMARDFV